MARSANRSPRPSERAPRAGIWPLVLMLSAMPGVAVAEADIGPDLPPAGRSLFDFITAGTGAVPDIPYPFPALLQRLAAQLHPHAYFDSPLVRLLIPLGRSLQRNAAAPEYFRFPRAVVAVDAEGAPAPGGAALHLKHLLYLGYQEKAGIIEVISYNEAAGRFEFQVVKDYREGATPRVFYANRRLCFGCHQNGGPIFARPLWDETNANRIISALLQLERESFYGIAAAQSVDEAYAFDNAVDQANRLLALQRVWREGCGPDETEDAVHCRAELLTRALQYRLSGRRHFDTRAPQYREFLLPHLQARWREQWPEGLALPDPDVPNRKPLSEQSVARDARALAAGLDVPAALEPLHPRAPIARWNLGGGDEPMLRELITGLGEFFADDDFVRLDRHLVARAQRAAQRRTMACEYRTQLPWPRFGRLQLRCVAGTARTPALQAQLYLPARADGHGHVRRLRLDGEDYLDLVVSGLEPAAAHAGGARLEFELRQANTGLRVRDARGNALRSVTLTLRHGESASTGTASAELQVDGAGALFAAALEAMATGTLRRASDALGAAPLRRAAVMRALFTELGMAPLAWCCDGTLAAPAPLVEPQAPARALRDDPDLARFEHYCGACHRSEQAFPPNFLLGAAAQVRHQLGECAPRIAFRLAMWRRDVDAREKTPMPPPAALSAHALSARAWSQHPDLDALQAYVARLLPSDGPSPLTRAYASLRPCVGAAANG